MKFSRQLAVNLALNHSSRLARSCCRYSRLSAPSSVCPSTLSAVIIDHALIIPPSPPLRHDSLFSYSLSHRILQTKIPPHSQFHRLRPSTLPHATQARYIWAPTPSTTTSILLHMKTRLARPVAVANYRPKENEKIRAKRRCEKWQVEEGGGKRFARKIIALGKHIRV